MKNILLGVAIGVLLMNVLPIVTNTSLRLYCGEGLLFGCDWDKGMIIEDWLYITIPW